MCGINGFSFFDEDLIKKMKSFTKNRGPDADGIFSSNEMTIAHDRLSIIDLNENANQPLYYKNYVLSFNGEIYNYKELKNELKNYGYEFKTNSDSEVILILFDKFKEESFKKLKGIFAICIWDKENKELFLIRDLLGVKPLYYYIDKKKNIYYSSSIRSILLSKKNYQINEEAFNYYKNFGRNDLNETIFKEIYKLRPGELLIKKKLKIIKKKFLNFSLEEKSYKKAEIKNKIIQKINSQLIADVPMALSLSGGIDSNVIYSVMREKYNKKFNIYSFYFNDYEKFNTDFNFAKQNAKHFNNNFIDIKITFNDFIDNAEKVSEILEEPTGNQCAILNYTMSKKIKEKVLITGDGGDETFTGYDKYKSIYIINQIQKFNLIKNFKFKFKNKNLNRIFYKDVKDMFLSFSEKNLYIEPNKYYKNFRSINKNDLSLNHTENLNLSNRLNSISLLDLDTVVPNEYLLRNDKIFANEGIEVRVPLLDQDIINSFLNLNEHIKFGYKFESKSLLKNLFKNDIHSYSKKKWGLQSPFAKWMKNSLQKFLYEILNEGYYSNSRNYFNFNEIANLLKRHKEEYFNPDFIWSLVMIQIFLRKFRL